MQYFQILCKIFFMNLKFHIFYGKYINLKLKKKFILCQNYLIMGFNLTYEFPIIKNQILLTSFYAHKKISIVNMY